jgi:hypothetical protein
MDRYWRARSATMLWAIVMVALAYGGLLVAYSTLTGEYRIDGAIGVALGLYVCSHPASNVLDLLFAEGGASRRSSADQHGLLWYALNLLVLLVGWSVVLLGIIRFTT